ncbi:hypothetical protein [Propionicicella superfundia]|uniref:hypothetical protein n=1 Tax=Propionicicella superfundia TaxID=348582 RepID=UPI00041B5E4A|nr:hypothetical protein [Propionicicella superfundia]
MGLALAVVLAVAGGLLTYANIYITEQVKTQLSNQRITMPSGDAIADERIKPYLEQYAGQEMTTGDQAYAFAEHYIAVHMESAGGGRTYEEVSGEYTSLNAQIKADRAAGKEISQTTLDELDSLAQLRQTLFMGNTLRGLLLNAYAFGTMAKIAGYAAIAAFVGAAVLLALGLLGLRHSKTATGEI